MNLGAVDAQDLARQPIEPGNYYRFKHGSIGGRPVSPNFLAGTNLTKRCTFERLDKFNCEEHTLQHSLGLKCAYEDCGACSGATAISSLDRIWCDYIFYSGPVKPVRAQSVPISTVPLPNANFGSDHYSITADFQIL